MFKVIVWLIWSYKVNLNYIVKPILKILYLIFSTHIKDKPYLSFPLFQSLYYSPVSLSISLPVRVMILDKNFRTEIFVMNY
jgi:hypothetical protein